MLVLRTAWLGVAVLLMTGSGATQPTANRLEMVKPDRCVPNNLEPEKHVRCFAWATAGKSGDIHGAEARCTDPAFVSTARNCLNDHRVKSEFRGAEEKICVEIAFRFSEPKNVRGVIRQSIVNSVNELATCELAVSTSAVK